MSIQRILHQVPQRPPFLSLLFVWLFIITTATTITTTSAYVTSTGLPPAKQMAWLRKMTVDICESPPGQLTEEMIQTAPDLMWAWAHAKRAGIEHALAVERLVKRLVDERRAGNRDAIATTDDYNCLLEGWARSSNSAAGASAAGSTGGATAGIAAAERCEAILMEMQDRYHRAGDTTVQPNLVSFKTVLMAWKQQAVSSHHHDESSYAAAIRAQRVLDWMIQLYQSGQNDLALPDADCFDMILETWSKSSSSSRHSNEDDAPPMIQAERLLGIMEQLYQTTGLEQVKPRTSSYNAVLSAWSKSGDSRASERAMAILRYMEEHQQQNSSSKHKHTATAATPDMATYTTVIATIAKSGDPHCGRKAELLLRQVEERYLQGQSDFAPDTILYNSVIGCWSKSNLPKAYRRAQAILHRQTHMYEQLGCDRCKPDVFSFTQVLASCSMEGKSNNNNSAEQAKAFHVAMSTYQYLRKSVDKYGAPTHVTYGTMLKAIAQLLPSNAPERTKWTAKVFSHCVEAGCVGDMVLSRLREAAVSREYYEELMQGYTRYNIPSEWSCHVNEKNEYRKKITAKRSRRRAEV